ncbi:MAG: hypothetical protein JO303_19160, partial [Caulobacteraceae bacterium]|nr:hypothetical protein [Caulobacteraceae bacterium]
MTLQEMLNSQMDFASLADLARRGWSWWIDELSAALPESWRDRLSPRPRTWIEPKADASWRLWAESRGRVSEIMAQAAPSDAKIGLLAPSALVLVREITVPRMPAADIRRMLLLDIDRLSPLAPELVHLEIEVSEPDEGE